MAASSTHRAVQQQHRPVSIRKNTWRAGQHRRAGEHARTAADAEVAFGRGLASPIDGPSERPAHGERASRTYSDSVRT